MKLYLRLTVIVFVFLMIQSSVDGYINKNYNFYNEAGDLVTGVRVYGRVCTDVECLDVSDDVSFWRIDMDSGTTNSVNLRFPDEPEYPLPYAGYQNIGHYGIYVFKENYLPSVRREHYGGGPGDVDDYNMILRREDSCISEMQFKVSSQIGEWFPLTINANATLDGDSQASFECSSDSCIQAPNIWKPTSIYNQYTQLDTEITARIKDEETDDVITLDPIEKSIDNGAIEPFEIQWDTNYPGNFTVEVTSEIVGGPCELSLAQGDSDTQSVEVFAELLEEACVIAAEPMTVTPEPIDRDEQGEISIGSYYYHYNKMYKGEYYEWEQGHVNWYDIFFLYKPIKADYVMDFVNRDGVIDHTLTGEFPFAFTGVREENPEFKVNTLPWTPQNYGDYEVEITMTSDDLICQGITNDDSRGNSVDDFYVEPLDFDEDTYAEDIDCDDEDDTVFPGPDIDEEANDLCDNKDNDCDGETDEGCECVEGAKKSCGALYSGICGDLSQIAECTDQVWVGCPILPGDEDEVCNDGQKLDEDCDGYSNCDDSDCTGFIAEFKDYCTDTCVSGYYDLDDEGSCEYACNTTDDPKEICDGIDNDCDGLTDEGVATTYYNDTDKDGFGNETQTIESCTAPTGDYVTKDDEFDCNDNNINVNPDATEVCDAEEIDENCDDEHNEDCACDSNDYTDCRKDCNPLDDNCVCNDINSGTGVVYCGLDGQMPACGFSSLTNYESTEVTCDGLDNDCDGEIDEIHDKCCDTGETKDCIVTCPNGEVIQGYYQCENYKWEDECLATCETIPVEGEVIINYPENGETYDSLCDEALFSIDFEGPDNTQCMFKINNKNFMAITDDTGFEARIGEKNRLTIRCGEIDAVSEFEVADKGCNEEDLGFNESAFENDFTKSELEDARRLLEQIEQETKFAYDGDSTIIMNSFEPDEKLDNVRYALFIPKCLAPHIDDIDFDTEKFEVIEENPLIAWHYAEVDNKVEFKYTVEGRIDPDCLKKIKGMPIADFINQKDSNPLKSIIIPGLIIMIVAGIGIYMQRFHPDVVKHTEAEYEEITLKKLRMQWVKRMKEYHMDPQHAASYMKNLNLTDADREFILEKLMH